MSLVFVFSFAEVGDLVRVFVIILTFDLALVLTLPLVLILTLALILTLVLILTLGSALDLGLVDDRLGDGADPVADVGAGKRELLPPPWTGKSTRDLPILPVCPLLELGRKSLADLTALPAFKDSVFSHCWRRDWHLGLELRLGPDAPSLLGLCPSLGGLFP